MKHLNGLTSIATAANKVAATSGFVALLLFLTCCHPRSEILEPNLSFCPDPCLVRSLPPPAFSPITESEKRGEWVKEFYIGNQFAKEFDFYRAITSYKRAYLLLPKREFDRRQQIQFLIAKSYYLGCKYCDVVETFEGTELFDIDGSFPAYNELLLMLYDSYKQTRQCKKQAAVLQIIQSEDPLKANQFQLGETIEQGNLSCLIPLSQETSSEAAVSQFHSCYCQNARSVKTAQTLNALLPGAGYFYVGQKKTALTSFLINAAFIATTWHFIDEGNWGAAGISGSLELGWYLGGINGAGLAAKEYNETLYNRLGKRVMVEERLFPIFHFETSF